jgi:hypothetical protein
MTVLHFSRTYFFKQLLGKYTSAELAPDPDVAKMPDPAKRSGSPTLPERTPQDYD